MPPFLLFWPMWRHFFTWPRNELSTNCRSHPPVSNAIYRLSLACFVFEISRDGRLSAPPVGTKLAQTPVGARVKLIQKALLRIMQFSFVLLEMNWPRRFAWPRMQPQRFCQMSHLLAWSKKRRTWSHSETRRSLNPWVARGWPETQYLIFIFISSVKISGYMFISIIW